MAAVGSGCLGWCVWGRGTLPQAGWLAGGSELLGPPPPPCTCTYRHTLHRAGYSSQRYSRAPPQHEQTRHSHPPRAMLSPKVEASRLTRASGAPHALKCLAGRTASRHWSLHQYDHSFLPAVIPIWNSLLQHVVGCPITDSTKLFCKRVNSHLSSL